MTHVALPDGRRLAYQVMGDPAGRPVIVVHGTPGSARQMAALSRSAREHGLAMITPDRAGYGDSSFDPDRTIGSSARDVGTVIEHLGLNAPAVVGLSGGGPTALACGVLLSGRVRAIATVGGVAPLHPRDPSLPPDRAVIKIASRSELGSRATFEAIIAVGRLMPERALDAGAKAMAEPDARLLRDNPEVRAAFLDDMRHASRTTARAAARDFRLFARPWDVDIGQMTVPVHVWHGTADRNVPVEHGRVVASRCPTAELHVVDGGGHMLLERLEEILASIG